VQEDGLRTVENQEPLFGSPDWRRIEYGLKAREVYDVG
jgi:hypothetical protein